MPDGCLVPFVSPHGSNAAQHDSTAPRLRSLVCDCAFYFPCFLYRQLQMHIQLAQNVEIPALKNLKEIWTEQ